METDLDELVSRWGKAATHRERAYLEKEIREQLKTSSADLSAILDGASTYELTSRTRFLLSGSEYVWKLLDEDSVQISIARRVLVRAENIAASKGVGLDEAIRDEYEESQRGTGARGSTSSRSWDLIKSTLESILSKDLEDVHEVERESVRGDVMADLDVFVRQARAKIRTRAKHGLPKDFTLVSEEQEKEMRRQFLRDMREVGVDAPRPGRLPDMALLKKTYRRVAGDHHPDRRPGEPEVLEKFKRVNESYQRILTYVEHMKGTSE